MGVDVVGVGEFFFMCIISGFGFEMREVEGVELYWTLNCKIMAVVC